MYEYNRRAGGTSAADADLFDLALVVHAVLFALRAPLRHPWVATIAFGSVVLASVAGIVWFPKRYEVATTILAGSPLSGALGVERDNDHRDVPTRAAREILLRRDNLLALAREVNLPERYLAERPPLIRAAHEMLDFVTGKPRTPESITEGLVETLEERLWVTASTEGDTVAISFQWWNTQIAYDVVNAAAQSFLEMRHAAEIKTVSESISILEERRAKLEKQIEDKLFALEAREKAETKDRRATPAVAAPRRPIAREDPELSRLQTRLAASRRAVADLDAARQQRIVELQSELLRQQSIYASDHPAITATKRMLDVLNRPSAQMTELGNEIRELEVAVAARGTSQSTRSLGSISHASSTEPAPLVLELDPREEFERGQVRHLRTQLEEINDRIAAASLRMETAAAAFKHRYSIVTPPRIPRGPIKPYTVLFGASGVLGGLLVSIIACAAADLRRGQVVERWQVERHFGLPILGDARRQM